MILFGFEIKKASQNEKQTPEIKCVASEEIEQKDLFRDFLVFKLKGKKTGSKTMPQENQAIRPIAFQMLKDIGANPVTKNDGTHIYGYLHQVRIDLWATTQKMNLSVIGNKKTFNGKQGIVEALKKLKETKSF